MHKIDPLRPNPYDRGLTLAYLHEIVYPFQGSEYPMLPLAP